MAVAGGPVPFGGAMAHSDKACVFPMVLGWTSRGKSVQQL